MSELDELLLRARARRKLPDPTRAKTLRAAAGVTVKELAGVLGVSERSVQYWEAGDRRPRGRKLQEYSDTLAALEHELGASP
jgi:DNA-binding transcriptional regulator YiaG